MAGRAASAAVVALLLALGSAPDLVGQPRASDDLIRYYQARISRRSGDVRAYGRLGQAYILKARETGDPQYYDLADQALARCLGLSPDPDTATRATTDLAVVHMARHQFREALAAARKALGYGSGDLNPFGLIGDAHLELGEYDRAEAAYEKMRSLQGAFYPHSRLSTLRFLKGDPAGAIAEMRLAAEAGIWGNQPKENVAWARFMLGGILFKTGDLTAAAQAHEDALATYPGYHRAQAGLAQVRAAQGRYPEAVELYRKQYDLVEYIGLLNAFNKVLYNRELALFYLDHDRKPVEALDLARKELEVRADLYTHDVLAWALYKNGKPGEALPHMADALRLGTKDARLLFHAGMIHRAAGDAEKARNYLQRALETNPHFHLLQAEVAQRTLRELGGPASRP